MALPIVAVVGRPNVGKSTFVNRIAQTQDAIVHEQAGVTRDRSYHRAEWNGVDFMLVDTGGIEMATDDAFGRSIRGQALAAAEEADVVVFIVDGRAGIQADDTEVAKLLKRAKVPVFLVVNKMDNPAAEEAIHEFWGLGLGDPRPVSSIHGHGTGDVLDDLVRAIPLIGEDEVEGEIRVAIIGRPNAGKSSLLNKLCGAERSIVSEVAGTTRDSIDTVVRLGDTTYRLIDTAGLRRQSKIDESVEYYSFVRALRSIDRADVALLVVDAPLGVTDQDQRVARFAEERGCAMVVLLNKWDALEDDEAKLRVEDDLPRKLMFVDYAPVLRISAKTGRGVAKILPAVDAVYAAFSREIPTSALNKMLTEMREFGHTVTKGKRTLRVNYVTQAGVRPPMFMFFCNHPSLADDNFRRYTENRLRAAFDLLGTPVKLRFRSKGDK